MIDKNEMRIGNYFIGEDKILWLSQIRHAENVKEWSYKGWHEETKERIEVNFFEAEPIPLTTEILEKCRVQLSEVKTVLLIVENIKTNMWWFGIDITTLRTEIKYVHQLQNVYYALTQKELEIKL